MLTMTVADLFWLLLPFCFVCFILGLAAGLTYATWRQDALAALEAAQAEAEAAEAAEALQAAQAEAGSLSAAVDGVGAAVANLGAAFGGRDRT